MSQHRKARWRLALGKPAEEELGQLLSEEDRTRDRVLEALYGGQGGQLKPRRSGASRKGGRGGSDPTVARWLGDIRRLFPRSVVQVMQRDAFERLGLKEMLLEPETLQALTPDVHLVATLLQLKDVMPDEAKDTARTIVDALVRELLERWEQPMRDAVGGSLNRARRSLRPRHSEIDWPRTILKNLGHYLPEQKTIVPERLVGYGRRRSQLDDVILCLDQSGSMASSVVYASIFGAVLASMPSLATKLVAFDTSVVDLTEALEGDPVDLLFGVQLGGGTDIARALRYTQQLVTRPERTTLVLVTDLFEGGRRDHMLRRLAELVDAGVTVITLLALDDEGAPSFDHDNAAALSGLSIPCFACTPDRFPSLMACALARRDVASWAASEGIVTARPQSG